MTLEGEFPMAVLDRIAFYRGRRDEVPNQKLARDLAEAGDKKGIREIAGNLWNENPNIQGDCLKVLYEIGYLRPELIADYVDDFLKLLRSKNNRMVWGGMIALSTISLIRARAIWGSIGEVIRATKEGSLITKVSGIKTLAGVASTGKNYRVRLLPILLQQLRTCPPRDLPLHAESTLPAVQEEGRARVLALLQSRLRELTPSQASRLRRVIRQVRAIG
jgi:hypothetical protein